MKIFILFSYFVTLILAFLIFLSLLVILRSKKKSAGRIQANWSIIFNFSSLLSWFIVSFIFAYFLWCVYQIATEPGGADGHHRLMFLLILLSFTPLGNIYLGSEGIILHMRFIPWKYVKEKEIIIKGKKRYLEIRGPLIPSLSKIKIKRILLPNKINAIN